MHHHPLAGLLAVQDPMAVEPGHFPPSVVTVAEPEPGLPAVAAAAAAAVVVEVAVVAGAVVVDVVEELLAACPVHPHPPLGQVPRQQGLRLPDRLVP